jgi:hypothetical protein
MRPYGFRDRERERNEARNVIVTAPANLTALLFNAPSEGQDSEIAHVAISSVREAKN